MIRMLSWIFTQQKTTPILQKQCSFLHYGQLLNDKLHEPLNIRSNRETACKISGQTLICSGVKTIQDYKPRDYYLSIGYDCDSVRSLEGLKYYIRVLDQANETTCLFVDTYCSRFYWQVSMPNLLGHPNVGKAAKELDETQTMLYMLSMIRNGLCHKHLDEIKCYIFLPQCNISTRQMIPPCKETCLELMEACVDDILSILKEITSSQNEMQDFKDNLQNKYVSKGQFLGCDYLPSSSEFDTPCFYKAVECESPPNVPHAILDDITNPNDTYFAHSGITYLCEPGFSMTGNNRINCMYNGNWTKPPVCEEIALSNSLVKVLLPLLIIIALLLILVSGIVVKKKRNRKKQSKLFRGKEYDAFVCYSYETTDVNFAESTIRAGAGRKHATCIQTLHSQKGLSRCLGHYVEHKQCDQEQQQCNHCHVPGICEQFMV